jgi:DNA ligase (NAD+)
MKAIREASLEDLSEVNEIGPIIAKSIHEFLHSNHGSQIIDDLQSQGVNMTAPKRAKAAVEGPLSGKTLVVTGTLGKYSRDEIEGLIEELGGRAASSVSKKTDYLVAGAEAGSKLDKAKKLGVKVISEGEFAKLVGR